MKRNLKESEESKVVGGDMTFEIQPEPIEGAPNAGWLKVFVDGVLVDTLHYLDQGECEMLQEMKSMHYHEDMSHEP